MTQRFQPVAWILAMLAALLSGQGTVVHAQEIDGYDAWARVFDAISPGWDQRRIPDGSVPTITPEDLRLIEDLGYDPGRVPTSAERAALERVSVLIPLLREATSTRTFSAPIDEADGWYALLPHLSEIRAASRTMNALANQSIADGDYGAAMDWFGRMMHSGGQVAQDEYFISSLVGAALAKSSGTSMDWLIGRGAVDQAMAAAWLSQHDWMTDSPDPFNLYGAMAKERRVLLDELTLISDALADGRESDRLELLRSVVGDEVLAGISSEDITGEFAILEGYFDRMEEALADPDRGRGLENLQAIDDEIAAADPPLLTAGILPDLLTLMEAVTALEREMDDRFRLLEGLATGRLDPTALRNPAILWLELGTRFEELPPAVQIAGLDVLGVSPTPSRLRYRLRDSTVDPDVEEILSPDRMDVPAERRWLDGLAEIGPSLTTLALDASAIDPEDFRAGTGATGPAILEAELERFRAAGLGLLIDATAHLEAALRSEVETPDSMVFEVHRQIAMDDLVSVIALTRGLMADPALSHLLIASDLLVRMADLLESPFARAVWMDDVHRDRLMAAITAIPREPALGLSAARLADLDRLKEHQFNTIGQAPDGTRPLDRLDTLSADAIYHIAVASHAARVAASDAWFAPDLPAEVLSDRSTPSEIGADEGYRPLRVLASMDEILGPGLIIVEDEEPKRDFLRARERLVASPTAARDRLMRLQFDTPPRIGTRGSEALNRVAELDRRARAARLQVR